MGTPPAADDSVCPERNVVRESRAAPPTKIACQVLKIIVHLSIISTKSFHLEFSSNGYSNKTEGEQRQRGKKRQER